MKAALILLPYKFITLILHFLGIVISLYSREDNIISGTSLTGHGFTDEYKTADSMIILYCTFMIIFGCFEFLLQFLGYTILNHQLNVTIILFHGIGVIASTWYNFEEWRYQNIKNLFWFLSFPPFILETIGSLFSMFFHWRIRYRDEVFEEKQMVK